MSEPVRTHAQTPLFVDSFEEAMEATAAICGGKKAFACLIRPELADDPEKAHRWFLDAINPDRRAEFHIDQILRACRISRERGCHILKHWLDDATGYERGTVAPGKTPQQELASKMRRCLEEFERLANEHAAIDRAETVKQLRSVP